MSIVHVRRIIYSEMQLVWLNWVWVLCGLYGWTEIRWWYIAIDMLQKSKSVNPYHTPTYCIFSCTNQINPSQVLDNIFAEEYAYKWTNVNHTKSEISILKLVISYELIHINVHLLCHNTCFCSMRPCPRETGNGVANWHMIETFPPLYRVIFHYTSWSYQPSFHDISFSRKEISLVCDLSRTPVVMVKHMGPCVHF